MLSARLSGAAALAAALFLSSMPSAAQLPPAAASNAPATLFGVGDIIHCSTSAAADATGRLMEHLLDTTPNSRGITFGDNSNDDGSEESYRCLHETRWGALMPRLYPTPGNHDYESDRVLPFYFLYFVNAGAPQQGYYAYDAGGWRVYALNSELMSDPVARQAQLRWLDGDLRANRDRDCQLAYFHRPPFSSGQFGSPAWTMPIFRTLYQHGVDVIATGHEHFFAALPPLTPEGRVDTAYGITTLIAGTGGARLFERPRTLRFRAAGEEIVANMHGILRITLRRRAFDWAFIPVTDGTPRAIGAGVCHENPPGVTVG
jgi:hypothetical protein